MPGKLKKLLTHRAFLTAISLALDIAAIAAGAVYAVRYVKWALVAAEAVGVFLCLYIISREMDAGYKLSWCIVVLAMPLFGVPVYLLMGVRRVRGRARRRSKKAADAGQALLNLENSARAAQKIPAEPTGTVTAALAFNAASYPVYGNTETKYYPLGDKLFPDLIDAIYSAQKFVFMEYFIISAGAVWSGIERALTDRARAGVEVKLIYDDFGSMLTLPKAAFARLRAAGAQILPFNRLTAPFNARYNLRTHRKLTVIDGRIAFTGGSNIADEYANMGSKLGHWKDTSMRFEGAAAAGFTAMFLSVWHTEHERIDFTKYMCAGVTATRQTGYVQPLASGPGRNERLIERVFLTMIASADRCVYMTTPYLIPDGDLQTALTNAALAGVDVRLIIPKKPDKKAVYVATKSFLPALKKAGVRIYTYTPGFIHSKILIVDDETAFIGTCNMDYRSFYLHYECGALLYGTDTVKEMRDDYLSTLDVSRELSYDELNGVTVFTRIGRGVLRLVAPML